MQNLEFLYGISLWTIAGGFFVLLLIALEFGFRAGQSHAKNQKGNVASGLETIQGAVLGLLGLLLAFTYSMASNRYDARKAVILEEANAIGTAYLRADVLPDAAKSEFHQQLVAYLDHRIKYYGNGVSYSELEKVLRQAEVMQTAFWNIALHALTKKPPTPLDSLFVASLNEVIDIHSKRQFVSRDHIPEIVLYLLMFVSALAVSLVGFGNGVSGRRNPFFTYSLAALIVLVIVVTLDLDRPRRGMVRVGQQSLIDLQKSLHKTGNDE